MSKKFLLFIILSAVASYSFVEFLALLIFKENLQLFGSVSLVFSFICALIMPIVIRIIVKKLQLNFNGDNIVYGVVLFVMAIMSLIVMYIIFPNLNISTVLMNLFIQWVLPVVIFIVSDKVIAKR